MKTEILIVSCAKHFDWLKYSIRSIVKFATGFNQIKIMIPGDDMTAINPVLAELSSHQGTPIRVGFFEDWPEKGFLRHEHIIMTSDEHCPEADFICHVDSDCLFTEPVTPEDYFEDGKPILYFESFASITRQYPEVGVWQGVTQNCLPFPVLFETMRRHPGVFHRGLYGKAREEMERKTNMSVETYVRQQSNQFPQTFCEFNTLGNVAMQHFGDRYSLKNMEGITTWPPQKLVQFWSHSPPNIPQRPMFKGVPTEATPDYFLK
jgi:hypothetical protein